MIETIPAIAGSMSASRYARFSTSGRTFVRTYAFRKDVRAPGEWVWTSVVWALTARGGSLRTSWDGTRSERVLPA